MSNTFPTLTKFQRKIYKALCLKLFEDNFKGNVSNEAVRLATSMSEAEAKDLLREMKQAEDAAPTRSELVADIKAKYTTEELQQIANGKVPERLKQESKKRIKKKLTHHRIGVLSDTHIGSVYCNDSWILQAFERFEREKCECILHCGDLTEGMKRARIDTQVYEISEDCLGYRKMRDRAVSIFEKSKLPVYVISGNHDKFFQDDADVVEDVAARVDNMIYLGYDSADILIGGVKIRLVHGGGGFSNMRLHNIVTRKELYFQGVKMVLAGHVHKYEWKHIQHVHAIHTPSIQQASTWMKSNNLYADTGYLIIEFDERDGEMDNVSVRYFVL